MSATALSRWHPTPPLIVPEIDGGAGNWLPARTGHPRDLWNESPRSVFFRFFFALRRFGTGALTRLNRDRPPPSRVSSMLAELAEYEASVSRNVDRPSLVPFRE